MECCSCGNWIGDPTSAARAAHGEAGSPCVRLTWAAASARKLQLESPSPLKAGQIEPPRAFFQYAGALSNGQSDAWTMVVGGFTENFLRLIEIIASKEHVPDLKPVLGPLLNFVEIALIRIKWIVGLFVGPVVHEGDLERNVARTKSTDFPPIHQSSSRSVPARNGSSRRSPAAEKQRNQLILCGAAGQD
jgi:hypothetical protein